MASKNHSDLIQELFGYLVRHIDLLRTHILDDLISHGVITQEQYSCMSEKSHDNPNLVRQLLIHLGKRPTEDFECFVRCLTQNNHQHVADHINNYQLRRRTRYDDYKPSRLSLPKDIPADIQDLSILEGTKKEAEVYCLQHLMAKILLAQYKKIKLWSWHLDNAVVPMEDMYVELILVKDERCSLGTEKRISNYKDILKKQSGRGTAYVMGEAGVGKSTFSRRLCVDWAERHQEASERTQGDDFLFVLPIFLRTVDKGQTIRDVFVTHYRIEDKEADLLCSFIDENQKSIMFILDGLDEFREKTSTEISDLIHKKKFPHVHMLITSRFPSYFVFGNGEHAPEIEYQLRGFSKEGVNEYLGKFYDKKKEEGDALLKKLRQSEDLEYLSHYPAVLLMMATLWHYMPTFNSTMTGFYLDYIKYLIARYEQKYLHFSQWKSPTDILTAYHEQLMKIGDVAIGGLSKDTLSLAFPYRDVIDHIGDATWQLGILVEETCFLRGRTVVFPHKTLQEFFISYRTVHAEEDKQKELLMHFCTSYQAFRESAMIRRFVIGMGGEKLQDHIQTLLSGSDQELARMHTDLQLDYLAENPKARIPLPRVVGLDITPRFPASHFVRYLSQNGKEVERVSVRSRDERHLRLLKHLHAPSLSQLELTKWTIPSCSIDAGCINQPWEKTLLNFPLSEITVNGLRDSKELCAVIGGVVQQQQLRVLTLNRTLLTGDPMKLLTDRLPESRCVRLTLSDCYLSLEEAIHVFQGLPETVTFLDVSDNHLKNLAFMSDEAIPLQHTHLKSLKMSECDLEPEDVLALVYVVPSTLSELDISRNFAGNGLGKLVEEAEHFVTLKSLDLSLNDMSQEVQQAIYEAFRRTCPLLNVKIDDK